MVEILLWVLAFIVGSLSAGRITRLITADDFPPILWLRMKWDDKTGGDEETDESPWNKLFHCHWCFSMWATAPIGLWAWLSNLHTSWWVFNTIMAAAYVAPMIVERDQKD